MKPLERQLNEAICIENTSIQSSLNSKVEYFHQNVKKIGIAEYQCNSCGRKLENEVALEQHKNKSTQELSAMNVNT